MNPWRRIRAGPAPAPPSSRPRQFPASRCPLSRPEDAGRAGGCAGTALRGRRRRRTRERLEVAIGFIFTIGDAPRRRANSWARLPSSYKLSQTQDFLRIVWHISPRCGVACVRSAHWNRPIRRLLAGKRPSLDGRFATQSGSSNCPNNSLCRPHGRDPVGPVLNAGAHLGKPMALRKH